MKLNQEIIDGALIVTVPVDALDGSNDHQLRAQLFALIQDHRNLILDLNQVQFIDSTGCGVMLAALKQLRAVGGDLKLCCITRAVRALFDLIGIRSVMGVFDTREEALEAFAEPLPTENV